MDVKQINKRIKKIPPGLVPEVMDYIDFLINKYGTHIKDNKSFNFSWESGLSDISIECNSIDLQHKALDWR
ncbi:MAG: DUF2281 domain-containing protein [Candidatus Marinimicrobia bacterium]|nr:DUF2281 domain-containing protein [Candidatus Neomarinimicrobiota bacterium]